MWIIDNYLEYDYRVILSEVRTFSFFKKITNTCIYTVWMRNNIVFGMIWIKKKYIANNIKILRLHVFQSHKKKGSV